MSKSFFDLVIFIDTHFINSKEELNKFTFFPTNIELDADKTFLMHPRRSTVLIEEKSFFEFIITEQINEIFMYITSSFAVKHLTINVLNNKSVNATASVSVEDITGSVGFNKKSRYLSSLKIENAQKTDDHYNYIWIDSMPTLKHSVSSKSNSVEIKQEIDNSFGLNVLVPSIAGIDISILKHCCFEIKYSIAKDIIENKE